MFTTFTHIRTATRALCALSILFVAGACGPQDQPEGGVADHVVASPAALTAEAEKLCRSVLATAAESAARRIVVVDDTTASVAAARMPAAFAAQVEEASLAGGSLTIVPVDGPGVNPRPTVLQASLSTPGERDRPSVRKLAALMPSCVNAKLGGHRPTAPDTDLHTAMATAAEFASPQTDVWTFSDLLSTGGSFDLDASVLADEPARAAHRVGAEAPLDLRGARWHVVGLASSIEALAPAQRAWMLEFARGLCDAWNASNCSSMALTPPPPGPDVPAPDVADPPPPFPTAHTSETATGCTVEVPNAVAFAGDSARLRDGIDDVLAHSADLVRRSPGAEVSVIGHTASVSATEGTGMALSAERARRVAARLAALTGSRRIVARGVGDTQPLAQDFDARSGLQLRTAARERRVTVTVHGVGCSR